MKKFLNLFPTLLISNFNTCNTRQETDDFFKNMFKQFSMYTSQGAFLPLNDYRSYTPGYLENVKQQLTALNLTYEYKPHIKDYIGVSLPSSITPEQEWEKIAEYMVLRCTKRYPKYKADLETLMEMRHMYLAADTLTYVMIHYEDEAMRAYPNSCKVLRNFDSGNTPKILDAYIRLNKGPVDYRYDHDGKHLIVRAKYPIDDRQQFRQKRSFYDDKDYKWSNAYSDAFHLFAIPRRSVTVPIDYEEDRKMLESIYKALKLNYKYSPDGCNVTLTLPTTDDDIEEIRFMIENNFAFMGNGLPYLAESLVYYNNYKIAKFVLEGTKQDLDLDEETKKILKLLI
jgi:hypothetical protein